MTTYASVSKYVRYAREANHMHVLACRLGYDTADHQHVEARQMFMCMARQIKNLHKNT